MATQIFVSGKVFTGLAEDSFAVRSASRTTSSPGLAIAPGLRPAGITRET